MTKMPGPTVHKFAWDVLRSGRDRLAAAVAPPFDLLQRLPEEGPEGDEYIAKCEAWGKRMCRAVSDARGSAQVPLNAPVCGPGVQCVLADSLIGRPPESRNDEFYLTWEQVITPGSDLYVKRWARYGKTPGVTGPLRARETVLDIRRHALDVLDWIDRAIPRLKSAIWPTLGLDRNDLLTVEITGMRLARPKSLPAIAASLLRDLAKAGKAKVRYREELKRFRNAVPELAPYLTVKNLTITITPAIQQRITIA